MLLKSVMVVIVIYSGGDLNSDVSSFVFEEFPRQSSNQSSI